MIIKKKKPSKINLGDILIIDHKEIIENGIPIVFYSDTKWLDDKYEGESLIFLFEVDDIGVIEDEMGYVVYSFYHIDELRNPNNVRICVEISEDETDYKFDVIHNPFKTLSHYKVN
jgi:hypothetical protein